MYITDNSFRHLVGVPNPWARDRLDAAESPPARADRGFQMNNDVSDENIGEKKGSRNNAYLSSLAVIALSFGFCCHHHLRLFDVGAPDLV